ncbi:MAG: DUF5652 family protein [Methanosarcinaceae archaeon]
MEQFLAQNLILILLMFFWVLPWKGYALWLSARKGQKTWFCMLLIVNSLAIMEILYIFVFSKRKNN